VAAATGWAVQHHNRGLIQHEGLPMIVVHHLNDSRSQRILWLLEELGLPYEIRHYARDATTRLAPPELAAVHPLGKSPVLEDGPLKLIESGAIIESIIRRHGAGRLQPAAGTSDFEAYNQWLHYAEGSAMLPLMLKLYTGRLGEAAAPLNPRIESELANHLGFVDRSLQGREWLVGERPTIADVAAYTYIAHAPEGNVALDAYPAIRAWLARIEALPGFVPMPKTAIGLAA